MKLGFIGTGEITKALVIGILGSKIKFKKIYLSKRNSKISAFLTKKSKKIQIKVGDVSLFKSLINSLDMQERWKLRLIRHFWRPEYFKELLNRLEKNSEIDAITFDTDKKTFLTRDRRKNITSARPALNGYQKGKCFYCFRRI